MRYLSQEVPANVYYQYRITDSVFVVNFDIPELNNLHLSKSTSCNSFPVQKETGFQSITYHDKTLIGENNYFLRVETNRENNYRLTHDSSVYTITKNHIQSNGSSHDIIVLLGPVLLLNLAINKMYCLHASAFLLNSTVFVVMGNSGTGKSTIARYFDTLANGQRLSDDLMPFNCPNEKLTLYPNFPQLKLLDQHQYCGGPIKGNIVFIFASKSESKIKLNKENPINALKKMINHTVATKLFSPLDLKSHLEICSKVSLKIPCYQLEYPHGQKSLENLAGMLNEIT